MVYGTLYIAGGDYNLTLCRLQTQSRHQHMYCTMAETVCQRVDFNPPVRYLEFLAPACLINCYFFYVSFPSSICYLKRFYLAQF